MMKLKHDDGLEWLRDIRRRMAKQFDYDPRKAGEHYRKMARRPGVKLYRRRNHLAPAR
jgi:hypothetical protein